MSSAGTNDLLCALCLTDEPSTPSLHLTMVCSTRINNWTSHRSEQYRFSFVSELISCTTTQNKIQLPPNPRGNEARSSAAPIQHCENCTAISSRYTTAKVLLDNNLLIKQQQLIKAKKLICTFFFTSPPINAIP